MFEKAWREGRLPRPLLALAAKLYGALARLDRWRQGLRPARRLPVPVISVGNLAVGGTGKTPLAAWVAGYYAQKGLRVAVLTRGYGRRSRRAPVVYAPHLGLAPGLAETGDEARVLSLLAPGAMVVVDADRHRGGMLAIRRLQAQVLVLDDGFQRRRTLRRDLDLLTAAADDPAAGGALLPLGRLREPLSQAQFASALVLSLAAKGQPAPLPPELLALPRFTARAKPLRLRGLPGRPRPLSWLKGRAIAAFCGLAGPERFWASLESLGARLVLRRALPDHAALDAGALQSLAGEARGAGAQALVCTLKDAVKLPAGPFGLSLPLLVLENGVEILPRRKMAALLDAALRVPSPSEERHA
jgi:tetraacyldisaccharide 4'-kinase